jgi:hypothetical protein
MHEGQVCDRCADKLHGAEADGIDFFMAHCERCESAIPLGEVVPVGTHNYCLDCFEVIEAELTSRWENNTYHGDDKR